MVIIHRRTFAAKVGKAEELISLLKDMNQELRAQGLEFKDRILTDYLSGRTDRVIEEMEVESLTELEASFEKVMASSNAQQFAETYFPRLNSLIHYAEVDNFAVR